MGLHALSAFADVTGRSNGDHKLKTVSDTGAHHALTFLRSVSEPSALSFCWQAQASG
jgi:hypothetical protein